MFKFAKHSNSFLLVWCINFSSVLNLSFGNDGNVLSNAVEKEKPLILHRRGRDADEENNVYVKVNDLNDTHQQLIVHWVGERSNIIICLARDSKEIRRVKRPSSVYYSYNYGETFENKSDSFKIPNGTLLQLDKFYIHPKSNSHNVFADSTNKMLFLTEDHGRTFKSQILDFVPSDITFYPLSPRVFLVLDKSTPSRKLYITQDFGNTWTMLQEYVKSMDWFSEDGTDKKYLVVQREELNGASILLKLSSSSLVFAKPDLDVMLTSINDVSVKGDFIFATKNSTDNGSLLQPNKELFIKYRSGPFIKSTFNTDLLRKDYHIADITNNRIMVAVSHSETVCNLYVSDIITEETQSIHFRLSLESIFCYFPNATWKSSLISGVIEVTFIDLHKVEGLRGVYIASQVLTFLGNASLIMPEHMVTRITFNWGLTWRPLNLTHQLLNYSSCKPDDACSLHLTQKFAMWYPSTRSTPILSSKSAPGLIIATGVYGKTMKGHASVYISRDAGVTWRQVLKENAYFNMGDHGGIIVAVKFNQKSMNSSFEIMYSLDIGETWQYYKMDNMTLKLYSLMTEPGENTTVFSLFASPPGNIHRWIVVKADFRKAFAYNCTEEDYKLWSPYNPDEPKMNCLLGRKEVYKKRVPRTKCYNGLNFDEPVKIQLCSCTLEDFMCDDGFFEGKHPHTCIRNKTLTKNPYDVPRNCTPYTFFQRTKGYKKIPGDSCEGGPREYLPDNIPCPIRNAKEFLLLAQKDRIVMFKLDDPKPEVLPIVGLQNVIAIDYDMENNCVFYADIVLDTISKWCLESVSAPKTIIDSRLHSVEGIAYDWISKHLYFADGVRGKIQVTRVDVVDSNQYRKIIINSTLARKPRGIAVHPVAGYLFWTDWAAGAPSINRANLDGSNPITLFAKPTVEWPNGIAVDFIAERIYWVDAREDYIASADFNGQSFKKIIEQDAKVSHPFSIAVFKDNMYWDDWRANAIYVADKDHGLGADVVASQLPGLMDLKVYAHSIQIGTNGCSYKYGHCSHLCFGLPDNKTSCQCPDDLILVDSYNCGCPGTHAPPVNGTCIPFENTCGSNYFRCNNGKCIPVSLKCDGENDCGDHSDEICENVTTTCESSKFRCGNGKCIPANWKCDRDFDCSDHSDEIGCHYSTCKSTQFSCDNGHCIASKWRCDNENDCRDGSDERNCTFAPTTCHADEFACQRSPGKALQCIPMTWHCDHEADCEDGSDEPRELCVRQKCELYQFQCQNKKCIFSTWRCDGDNDCGDASDEANCTDSNFNITSTTTGLPKFPCTSQAFACLDHKMCIPLSWKCDNATDCSDGSDEIGCTPGELESNKTPPTSYKPTNLSTCSVNEFYCSPGHCIPQSFVCDNQVDCLDGEDEKHCDGHVGCKSDGTQFRCRKTGICISIHKLCDGKKDCLDGSDEGLCDKTLPTVPPLVCQNGYFKCDEIQCEPLYKKCNGQPDCRDEVDERDCISPMNKTFQVTNLRVDRSSDDSILISWSVQPPPVKSENHLEYLPSITSFKNNSWINTTDWITYQYYLFVNLRVHASYTITVYVRDTKLGKIYPPANYLKATTGIAVPSPPTNVTIKISNTSYEATSLFVSWSPPEQPNGEIIQYVVSMEPPYPPISIIVSGSTRNATLVYPLQNDIEYFITVKAQNYLYMSIPSAPQSFRYEGSIPKNVLDLKADGLTDNSVTLKWKPVSQPGVTYNITILLDSKRWYPLLKPRSTKETEYTVTGLSPGVNYTFEVSLVTSTDVTLEPSKVKATTLGTELPTVSNLSVKIESAEVIVTWEAPKEKKKVKYKYAVFFGTSIGQLLIAKPRITDETNVTIYDMPACGAYLFDVSVVLQDSYGPLTGVRQLVMTGIDTKAAPRGLKISRDMSAEPNITIMWRSSCEIVNVPVGYMINVIEVNTKESYSVVVNASQDNSFRHVFGAKFGCHYNISVSTTETNAEVKWIEYETLPIPPPYHVNAYPHEIKENGFIVVWDVDEKNKALKNLKYKFEILVCEGRHFDVDHAKIYTASKSPMTITDVKDEQTYMVAVRIVTHDGLRSHYSEPITVRRFSTEASIRQVDNVDESSSFKWFLILCVILIGSAACFVYWKRKRSQMNNFKNLANSHYNTRSGSTTFTGVNGLDMDDSHEVREHFSDDEPLVIA